MPLPITGKSPPFSSSSFFAAACVLHAVYYPAPPLPFRSPAIRKKKARHFVFFLFISLAQTTPAQPAGGTSPSVGLLVSIQLSIVTVVGCVLAPLVVALSTFAGDERHLRPSLFDRVSRLVSLPDQVLLRRRSLGATRVSRARVGATAPAVSGSRDCPRRQSRSVCRTTNPRT